MLSRLLEEIKSIKGHIHIKYKLVSNERSLDVDNAAYLYFSFLNDN